MINSSSDSSIFILSKILFKADLISMNSSLEISSCSNEIKSVLNGVFDKINIDESEENLIIGLLIHDKKNEYGKVQFALLNGIGNIKLDQITDNETIKRGFQDYKI